MESPPYVSEDDARFWDLLIKGFGIVATIVGFVAAISTLRVQHDQLVQQQKQFEAKLESDILDRQEQYKREFWKKRLELYSDASRVTSLLATGNPLSDDWKSARKRFDQLYWGELSIVESREVESAMVRFRGLLITFEDRPEVEALRQIPSDKKDAIGIRYQGLGRLPRRPSGCLFRSRPSCQGFFTKRIRQKISRPLPRESVSVRLKIH